MTTKESIMKFVDAGITGLDAITGGGKKKCKKSSKSKSHKKSKSKSKSSKSSKSCKSRSHGRRGHYC